MTNEDMAGKILILRKEPRQEPEGRWIPNTLEAMQKEVGGYIECITPYEDNVVIICDEEGKLKDKEANLRLPHDVVCGTVLLARVCGEEFGSLTQEQFQRYWEMWQR